MIQYNIGIDSTHKIACETMKLIFFVLTFGSIYSKVLPLIEAKKKRGDIIIVAATKQIESFFTNYTDFPVIRIKIYPDLITRDTTHLLFINILRSKIEYPRLFKKFENDEVYFFNKGCAVVAFSYIKKLSKKNKVYFYYQEGSAKKNITYHKERSIRSFFMKVIAKFFLNVDTIILNNKGYPYWFLDEPFFDTIEVLRNPCVDREAVGKYMTNIEILKGKQVLIAIEDSIAAGNVEREEFIQKMDLLMGILEDVASGKYAIKPHPRLDRLYGEMAKTDACIPTFIPFEMVMHHPWKAVIGIDSSSLVSASQNTDAKVISLIDVIKFKDEKFKKMFRDWLHQESNGNIVFPKKIDELKNIITYTR